ncbi:hypothetical protein [Allorhodopirellula heiligendammensis]|uniref:MraY-like glycosyltransferase n=1 Tax=Allorhodopirellula heiligendammensis TaxID=2714739 RepID=A0A5C6BHE7_9BACT|nr:hypothetical protein [Allorhodopirellula heiligendammensis]TWU11132.1 MraY-like glycosyltransferase [Allorhodopirellula heiligendammensis]
MNTQSFLDHHGIVRNPFAEEDAQTDPVFKQHCIRNAYHPAWDKVYGDPTEPATAIIFGPKGSGKTAMRLQIDQHLVQFNAEHPGDRDYIIRYDDFNPFLDHFCERLGKRAARKPEKALDAWRLWDHMDAIMCLGVTELIDQVLSDADRSRKDDGNRIDPERVKQLDRNDARDLLLLAACYDQSTTSTFTGRFAQLRQRLGFSNWTASIDFYFAVAWSILVTIVIGTLFWNSADEEGIRTWNLLWLIPILIFFGKLPYVIRLVKNHLAAAGIHRHMRVGKRETAAVRKVLMQFPGRELESQPMPRYDRTDDRYELLRKFQGVLSRLGFDGMIVLMDRVDEPHMTGGKPELMRRFVWPLLDNKLLKHPGLGFKMMLPEELYRDTERETREFHERARLDKQNVIPAFQWTGESLYDLTRARMSACAAEGETPEPRDLFEDSLSYEKMLVAFESLRVPRHLFRFLYRVVSEHCNRFTDSEPQFKIEKSTFETVLAVYTREMTRE